MDAVGNAVNRPHAIAAIAALLLSAIISMTIAPSPALGYDAEGDVSIMAERLATRSATIDVSDLGWDRERAADALHGAMSTSVHYSDLDLVGVGSCTLFSKADEDADHPGSADHVEVVLISDEDDIRSLNAAVTERIERIAGMARLVDDERTRAWLIYRALAESIAYDKDYDMAHTPYGALLYHRADCTGISCAYKLICDASGIDCEVVSGTVARKDGILLSHAWHTIVIDGTEFQVDVTFALTEGAPGQASDMWFMSAEPFHGREIEGVTP